MACQHDEWQVRPGQLPFNPSNERAGIFSEQAFLGDEDGTRTALYLRNQLDKIGRDMDIAARQTQDLGCHRAVTTHRGKYQHPEVGAISPHDHRRRTEA
jgi:hypothetical protein